MRDRKAPSTPGNPWRGALAYTVLVVLWGAVVRITGSGAGCGQHWPTCQGDVLHIPDNLHTAIEFSHRVTSGLNALLVFGLAVFTLRRVPKGHIARKAALAACALMIVESLIGAALVLLGYVGGDVSRGRAAMMPVHLSATLGLTGSIAVAACSFGWHTDKLGFRNKATPLVVLGSLGIFAVAALGAITALGDTLFPITGAKVTSALSDAASASSHFLERMRGLHPVLAVLVSLFLLWAAPAIAEKSGASAEQLERSERWARAVFGAVLLQLFLGVTNVWLSAPGYMQVFHLAAALLLWLCWVALCFSALSPESPAPQNPASEKTAGTG